MLTLKWRKDRNNKVKYPKGGFMPVDIRSLHPEVSARGAETDIKQENSRVDHLEKASSNDKGQRRQLLATLDMPLDDQLQPFYQAISLQSLLDHLNPYSYHPVLSRPISLSVPPWWAYCTSDDEVSSEQWIVSQEPFHIL